MMRSSLASAFLVCAFGVVLAPAASAQTKVGVIDLQRAILGTSEIKKASNDLQVKFKPRQDELEKLQKEMAEIQEKLQNPQTPAPQAQDLQLKGQRDQREAQRLTEDLQADVERERGLELVDPRDQPLESGVVLRQEVRCVAERGEVEAIGMGGDAGGQRNADQQRPQPGPANERT